MADIFLTDRGFSDFNPLLFGKEECKRGKHFGPAIRKYTLIHYVEKGCGIFVKGGGNEYKVKAGEAFIILPDEITYYEADKDTPWVYRWIGFNGALSAGFSELFPVVSVSDGLFPNVDIDNMDSRVEYVLAGQLFTLAASLFSTERKTNQYVKKVKDFIKSSYMQNVKVEGIAESMSLNRRYLSRIFKEETGKSIQEYLIHVRMEEARRLLECGHTVSESAMLSGYSDLANFSKMYKRIYGKSPKAYKQK